MIDNNLTSEIERIMGRKMQSSQDFVWLSEQIFNKLHKYVSVNTLKRCWGYLASTNSTTRRSTLDILAQFIGFRDYVIFCQQDEMKDSESNQILSRHLKTKNLAKGLKLHVTWLPDRDLIAAHMGDGQFTIINVENSKLSEGDVFEASLIIENEPLYLCNLIHDGQPPISYVAGKINGVRFEVIED